MKRCYVLQERTGHCLTPFEFEVIVIWAHHEARLSAARHDRGHGGGQTRKRQTKIAVNVIQWTGPIFSAPLKLNLTLKTNVKGWEYV